MFYILT